MTSTEPTYLTTKEVADLLRVKERKVYDLIAAGEIPHRRIIGKLLFPRAEIVQWIEGTAGNDTGERPAVLTGSHDPLLDWAVRESGCGLATLLDGSGNGLETYAGGDAALCGLHIPDGDDWNVGIVAGRGLRGSVLLTWAQRARGLVLAPAIQAEVACLSDLKGKRVVMRQPGAGAAVLFERLLAREGLSPEDFVAAAGYARTESDAAAAVASGEADAALGLETMARQFHLGFLPLVTERFDLLVDRRAYFTEPVQKLLAFTRTQAFVEKARAMGGYDLSGMGEVRWLSP
ncbi:helix-turn-helix transcriptional regulator [Ostreiculturibacter nitratireducens]|uniref:helix-turn-helix transcriptional regulator n=1 Tax=Ostreiculturibacter nitratireducens TaxID=3075226 RepID=UPI0031B60CDC